MRVEHVGDQPFYLELLAVCGFSLIGLVISARLLFELGPVLELI